MNERVSIEAGALLQELEVSLAVYKTGPADNLRVEVPDFAAAEADRV